MDYLYFFTHWIKYHTEKSWDKTLYENQETSGVMLSSAVSYSLKYKVKVVSSDEQVERTKWESMSFSINWLADNGILDNGEDFNSGCLTAGLSNVEIKVTVYLKECLGWNWSSKSDQTIYQEFWNEINCRVLYDH